MSTASGDIPVQPEGTPAPDICPKCGGRLSNPETLGWCSKCGYCKSTDPGDSKILETTAKRPPSALGIVEFIEILKGLPTWSWVLMGGAVTVLGISLAA